MNPDDLRYEADLSSPDMARCPGCVRFTQHSLRFEGGEDRLELPLEGLVVHWSPEKPQAGASFTHPGLPGWRVAAGEEVLEHPVMARRTHLRSQLEQAQRPREVRRRVLLCAVFLAGFALLSLIGWAMSGMAVGFIVKRIPVSMEVKLGEKLLTEIRADWKVLEESPQHLPRLNAIKDRLLAGAPASPYKIRMHVVENSIPNAFAVPGGHILVHTGLMKLLPDDEELAGVIAHEIAHVEHRHSLRQVVSEAGPALLFHVVAGNSDSTASLLASGFHFLLRQRFSRDHEREADEEGWRYLVSAGMDPRGMIRMMQKLKAEEDRLAILGRVPDAISSHPASQERIDRLHRLWDELPDKARFEVKDVAAPP